MVSFYWWLNLKARLGSPSPLYEQMTVIRASGLFEAAWYNRDTARLKRWFRDPVIHYLRRGAAQGRDPHPLFDTKYYRRRMRKARQGVNPLVHYHTEGGRADINPIRWFDSAWYRAQSLEPLPDGVTPLLDFCQRGSAEARSPHPLFEIGWYVRQYAGEVGAANPLVDYLYTGSRRRRVPHRAFFGADRIAASNRGAVLKAVETAMTTKEPRAPRNVLMHRFDDGQAARFIAETRAAAGKDAQPVPPPLVSIVMPTRDRAELMRQAVASVLAQSYANWELLIVDDGSTDDTPAVVASYMADSRVRYIEGNGRGAAAARNIALASARGALIAYLDTDNAWTPEFLEIMVGFLGSADLELAYSGMRVESEGELRYRGRYFDLNDLIRVNYIDLNAVMHRRELVERHGAFDESLRRMIDWDLIIRYARRSRVAYGPFVGVIYSDHKAGSDRISVREPLSWKFVVLNRYLVDWARLRAEAPERDADLVSIVIPIYGNLAITNDCLESIYAHPPARPFEVILVNNKSDAHTSSSLALWELARTNVRVLRNWTNLNFAMGCNLGFAESRGATVVFLNNDTIVTPGWLDHLAGQLLDERVGVVQPKLLYPDGTVQSIGAVFSSLGTISYPLYRDEPGDAPHVNRRRTLQALHGACLAMRAEDFARLDGFDPHFVNGQEDIDLCLRLTVETGKTSVVDPGSVVIHLEGKTRGRNPYLRGNRALFVKRWAGRVVADDAAIYAEDGFVVTSWRIDSDVFDKLGIAVHYPDLRRSSDPAQGAGADWRLEKGEIEIDG